MNENEFFGQTAEFYQVISWITDKSHNTPFVHVRGIKGTGKSRFITQIGRLFY